MISSESTLKEGGVQQYTCWMLCSTRICTRGTETIVVVLVFTPKFPPSHPCPVRANGVEEEEVVPLLLEDGRNKPSFDARMSGSSPLGWVAEGSPLPLAGGEDMLKNLIRNRNAM